MQKRLFSYPFATEINLSDKLHGFVDGVHRIFTLQNLQDLFLKKFTDGVYDNARITVINNQITTIEETPSSGVLATYGTVNDSWSEIPSGGFAIKIVADAAVTSSSFISLMQPQNTNEMLVAKADFSSEGNLKITLINLSDGPITPLTGYRYQIIN